MLRNYQDDHGPRNRLSPGHTASRSRNTDNTIT